MQAALTHSKRPPTNSSVLKQTTNTHPAAFADLVLCEGAVVQLCWPHAGTNEQERRSGLAKTVNEQAVWARCIIDTAPMKKCFSHAYKLLASVLTGPQNLAMSDTTWLMAVHTSSS